MATESFGQMTECLFGYSWYELPVDLQKYFVLMIANAQQPMFYNGFKIAVLNLETFTKVS